MTKSRGGIAQFEATIVLVVVSLSLASVVYTGLRRESGIGPAPVFTNDETPIGGTPTIELVAVNSSSATSVTSLGLDAASSANGILAFDGSGYVTTTSLCEAGDTTFFSVLSPESGTLEVSTDGTPWVAGTWGSSVTIAAGWQEVMIQGGSSCSVTLPGGQQVLGPWTESSTVLSSIPTAGALSGSSFTFYVPTGSGSHHLLLTTSGGFDDVQV